MDDPHYQQSIRDSS